MNDVRLRPSRAALALALLLHPLAALAQRPPAAPPSPADVLGYGFGERFTPHADVLRYMRALADAAPERVHVERYGATVEGRPLVQVVIASAANMAHLDEILERHRRLTDPALPEAEAARIAAEVPAVVYLSYGVHGNESSSSEASMWTAWDVVRGAEAVRGVLDSTIVVIDPAVNPDGRDRYVTWYRQARGREPNPDPASREHHEPWPGGRFDHYLFDMNRDWAWMTQAPTRARLATWDRWSPQVHVDFHEMSPTSSYFFFPATEPINPIYPQSTLDWSDYFGRANAAAFDAHGWTYFTHGTYDFFYPGYGDSWPGLTGAIGMTYEQAGGGSAGLAYARPDGDTLTLADRAMHHRVAGDATLRAAAARKTALLTDYARFHRTVADGLSDFLLVPGADPARVDALVALLQDEGIRVENAGRAFRADAAPSAGAPRRRDFPAGTFLVRARQPRGRLAVTLLQPETVLKATFSYDISAWSLPYAYGVQAYAVDRAPDAGWSPAARRARIFDDSALASPAATPVSGAGAAATGAAATGAAAAPSSAVGNARPGAAPYGYLVPPGFSSWPGVIRFLHDGGRASVLDEPFTLAGRAWPRGTLFLRPAAAGAAGQGPEAATRPPRRSLEALVRAAGLAARAKPVSTGLTPTGNDLGTEDAYPLRLPRVGVLAGEGVNATSYGAHWFFLEHYLRLPFDALLTDQIGRLDLDDYDVIVLPDARPASATIDALKAWVEKGGTLVAVGAGARAVAEPVAGVKVRAARPDSAAADSLERALRGRAQRELDRWEQDVPGTILDVTLDPANPLAFGAGIDGDTTRMFVLHSSDWDFEPNTAVETAAYFPPNLDKVSGVISQENLDRLARGAWLLTRRVKQGRVILFADDPLFRSFWFSGFQPYANALLVGPRM